MKTWTTHSGQTIHRILERRCNCYLVAAGDRFLLVDAGRENRWSDLKNHLLQLGVTEGSLNALVLTHSHFDHAENAANLQRAFGAVVVIHCLEAAYLQQGKNPLIRGAFGLTRWLTDSLQKPLSARFHYQPVEADILVDEKMDLQTLGCTGYVLHTPGHTAGSVSVIVDDEIALVGDTLSGVFPGTVFPPFLQDPGLLLHSWGKLLQTRCSLFLPAHGRPRSRALLQRCYDMRSR
ncbi:MBL fold metallo-hydrolase [bacterium]|nr:MBL fold metallo-hydrolase [bacterium]